MKIDDGHLRSIEVWEKIEFLVLEEKFYSRKRPSWAFLYKFYKSNLEEILRISGKIYDPTKTAFNFKIHF